MFKNSKIVKLEIFTHLPRLLRRGDVREELAYSYAYEKFCNINCKMLYKCYDKFYL